MLSRDDILKPRERKYRTISAFGGKVRLKELTGLERAEFEDATSEMIRSATSTGGLRRMAAMLVFTVVDEEGGQVFSMEDVDQIANLPFPEVEKVFTEAVKLNALTKEDVDSLGKD